MHSSDSYEQEDDTIRIAMKSQRQNLFQEPKRFQNITKKLYTQPSISPYKNLPISKSNDDTEININDILIPRTIILNNQQFTLRCQLAVTSKGVCYILRLKDRWINLSWLHSVKRIEKTKILLLHYHMNPVIKDKKPTLEPQLIEFKEREELQQFYKQVIAIHTSTHDEEIEKLYHKLI